MHFQVDHVKNWNAKFFVSSCCLQSWCCHSFFVHWQPRSFGARAGHGPNPRNYDYAFPKRARRAALRNALSAKMAAGQLMVVEGWDLQTHKTKALAATLEKLGVKGSALLVGAEKSPKLLLASGNNPKLRAIESLGVNVYELLKYDQVVFSKEAVLALQEVVKP